MSFRSRRSSNRSLSARQRQLLEKRQRARARRPRLESLEPRWAPAILGPDSFGYTADDGVPFSYEDISATGTALQLADDATQQVSLGFGFPFYGTTHTSVFVSTNGLLTFGSGNASFANADLNQSSNPGQPSIAALWDDWFRPPGDVFVQTLGSAPDRRFVVHWRGLEHFVDTNNTIDFQAVLFENGQIELRYQDVILGSAALDNGASATVGIRDQAPPAPGNGRVLQYSFNQPQISNGEAIRFALGFVIDAGQDPGGDNVANDGQADTFRIVRSGDDAQVFINGDLAQQIPIASLPQLTVQGSNDNDRVQIDYSGGSLPFNIIFNGGAGDDDLSVVGAGTGSASYTPDASVQGNGTLSVTVGSDPASLITFTGLEPVDISGFAVATLALPNANDTLTIANGTDFATGTVPALRVSGTTGDSSKGAGDGTPIETVAFFNNGEVLIDTSATDGDDVVRIQSASNDHNNVDLTILTGSGDDQVEVNGQVVLNDPGSDFSVESQRVQLSADITVTGTISLDAGSGPIEEPFVSLLTAESVVLGAGTGIGDSIDDIDVAAQNLAAETDSGQIFITQHSGDLTITTLNLRGGATISGVRIRDAADDNSGLDRILLEHAGTFAPGALTVASDIVNEDGGQVVIRVLDAASTGQDLTINSGVRIETTGSNSIELFVGDNFSLPVGAQLITGGNIEIEGDVFGNLDAGVGVTMVLAGQVQAQQVTLEGQNDADLFQVTASNTTPIHVIGRQPSDLTQPGDVLQIDASGSTERTIRVTNSGTGEVEFGGTPQAITFTGIEQVTFAGTDTQYHLIVDMEAAVDDTAGADADEVRVRLVAGDPTRFEILIDGVLAFRGNVSDLLSLTVIGSNEDDDTLVIDEVNGRLTFQGVAPGTTTLDNVLLAGQANIVFHGADGDDTLRYENLLAASSMTYALGDGSAGSLRDRGEVLTFQEGDPGNSHRVFFTGLEPITVNPAGTPLGTLRILGTAGADVLEVVDADDVGGPAGFTRVRETSGFEFFDFAANTFTRLEVFGMNGGDTIDLISLDENEVSLTVIRLDGDDLNTNADTSSDTLRVRSSTNLPATSVIELFGGQGDDRFELDGNGAAAGGTVNGIAVEVIVSPTTDEDAPGQGIDRLVVIDFDDPTSDTVEITSTTIEGITGFGGGPDIRYNNGGTQIEFIEITTSNQAVINGDEIRIRSTSATSSYIIRTSAGNDTIHIGDDDVTIDGETSSLDSILGPIFIEGDAHEAAPTVTLNGNTLPAGDLLSINDQEDTNANTYTLTPTTVQRSGSALITYNGLESIQLNAGQASDTITASTGANTNTSILGNLGADTITLTSTGGGSNTFVLGDGFGHPLDGADTLIVLATAATSETFVAGGSGDDTIHVGDNETNIDGEAQSLDTIAGNVVVNGDAGSDTLNVNDQEEPPASNHTYAITPTTVQRTGTGLITYGTVELLRLNAGQGSDTITIDAAPAITTIVNANSGSDFLNLLGAGAGSTVTLSGDGFDTNGDGLTDINVVRPADGSDTFNIGDDESVVNGETQSLDTVLGTVNVFGNAGADILNVNDQEEPAASSHTYSISATTVQRAGTGLINYGTVETLNLNAGQGSDTIRVTGTAAITTTFINANAGNDTIHVGDDETNINAETSSLDNLAGPVIISGGAGTDTLNVNDQEEPSGSNHNYTVTPTTVQRVGTGLITYGAVETLRLNAGQGHDNIQVTAAAGLTTIVNANSGNDVINLLGAGAGATVTLNGDGFDTNGDGLTDIAAPRPADGNDTINVLATNATIVNVDGDDGDDVINIGDDETNIDGETQSLDAVLGPVNVVGDAGLDTLNVNDQEEPAASSHAYTITATTVQRAGTGLVSYSAVELLRLDAGQGSDSINVTAAAGITTIVNANSGNDTVNLLGAGPGGTVNLNGDGFDTNGDGLTDINVARPADGNDTINVLATNAAAVNVNGNDGNDTINVGDNETNIDGEAQSLDTIQGTVNVAGNAGTDTLNVNDQEEPAGSNHTYSLTPATVQRSGTGLVNYGTVETLRLNAGQGNDTITANAAATITTIINANSGNDRVDLLGTGANANVIINGDGFDTNGDGVTDINAPRAADGNDILNVEATGAGSTTLVQGQAGDDLIQLSATAQNLTPIQGQITIDGGANSGATTVVTVQCSGTTVMRTVVVGDTLQIFDQNGQSGRSYTINANTIDWTPPAPPTPNVFYTGIETLELHMALAGTVVVNSTQANRTIINGSSGQDTVTINSTAPLAVVQVNAAADDDRITVNNTGNGALLDLQGEAGVDRIDLEGSAVGSFISVHGGTENDLIRLTPTQQNLGLLLGEVCVEGDEHDGSVLANVITGANLEFGTVNPKDPCPPGAQVLEITTNQQPVGDVLELFDNGSHVYEIEPGRVRRDGVEVVFFSEIETLNLHTGSGDDRIFVELPPPPGSPLQPTFININGGVGGDDRVKIVGTAGTENLFVGAFGIGPIGVAQVEALHFVGVGGDDQFINNTSVPSLIEGTSGDNLIIGGSGNDVIFSGGGSDTIFGGAGNDTIFADRDRSDPSTPIPDAPGQGDIIEGGPGTDRVVQTGVNDRVGSVEVLVDGGACKDVITWLKAQILELSAANLQDLLNQANINALAVDAPPPPPAPKPTISLLQNPFNAPDVNADGEVTPLDALLVVNFLNLTPSTAAEGEAARSHYYDVNGDLVISPVDALIVINLLNSGQTTTAGAQAVAEGEYDVASALSGSLAAESLAQSGRQVPSVSPRLLSEPTRALERSERIASYTENRADAGESVESGSFEFSVIAERTAPAMPAATVSRTAEVIDRALEELLAEENLLDQLAEDLVRRVL